MLALALRCFFSRGLWLHGGTSLWRFYSRTPALARTQPLSSGCAGTYFRLRLGVRALVQTTQWSLR